jgi:ligand-binding SRPBCC domain-containing protein
MEEQLSITRGKDACYVLRSQTTVHRNLSDTFDFFANAENLNLITPAWLKFTIVSETPIKMGPGTQIDYRLKIHGFPVKWRSEISLWEPPYRFVDTQIKGPYLMWSHTHTLDISPNGHTIVNDYVKYKVPFGRVTNRLFVARDLKRIFRYRNLATKKALRLEHRSTNRVT